MTTPGSSSLPDTCLDGDKVVSDHAVNPANIPHEKEVHHNHGPEEAVRSLLAAAARFEGGGGAFHPGSQQDDFPRAREAQLRTLSNEPGVDSPGLPHSFVGGEHIVFIPTSPETVVKQTLPGFYGRILDERSLLDPRTFLNRRQLVMRGALPSEYLRRWAVIADVFGLATTYHGRGRLDSSEPPMIVSQPFIFEPLDDPATDEDVSSLMEAHSFKQVSASSIVNPEIQNVTWYRQHDGLLMTDAHARNFRKDSQGLIFPIDLVVTTVPMVGFSTVPQPDSEWKPSYEC